MASTQTSNGVPTIETAFEQAKELNEQALGAARKVGTMYLDAYEQTVDGVIDLELKVAGLTQQEWLTNLIEAQADFARELTGSYTSAARSLLA